jgi:glycosyltransferase involved in cell wall biosynthesis
MCELTSLFGDHSEINAAIIATARAAFPEDPVYFIATHKHCKAVDKELTRHGVSKIFYEELPDNPTSSGIRLICTVRSVFRSCRKHGCTRILIGGFNRRYHNMFSFFMPRWFSGGCYGLVHHQGVYLLSTKGESILQMLKMRVTSLLWSNRIKVLVLGPTVADYLVKHSAYPNAKIEWIYHPYFYNDGGKKQALEKKNIQFVFLGRTAKDKGFDIFCRIANEISNTTKTENCRFVLIGGLSWKPIEYFDNGPVVRVKKEKWRLTREDLVSELQKASYLIMPYDRANFGRTNVSGTFFDAVKYLKPIIALSNPELSLFFEKFGDLGYLCESTDEMRQLIGDITENPPSARYSEQQACLLKAREFFHHTNRKDAFRKLWAR